MADTKNTEVPPASEPPASVPAAPVAVRERRSWLQPLLASLVVVAALVVGGFGGFALATATHAGGRPALEQGGLPGQPGMGQPGMGQPGPGGPQQGPRDRDGDGDHQPPPGGPSDDSDGDDDGGDDSTAG
jgi:hypothetical protein